MSPSYPIVHISMRLGLRKSARSRNAPQAKERHPP
jgi:hypothetical protein